MHLNIRSALDESDPIPVSAYTDGTVADLAIVEPRLFVLFCTFDY